MGRQTPETEKARHLRSDCEGTALTVKFNPLKPRFLQANQKYPCPTTGLFAGPASSLAVGQCFLYFFSRFL